MKWKMKAVNRTMDLPQKEISFGVIGLGAMGKGLVYQSMITPRTNTLAVCDVDTDKACRVLRAFNLAFELAEDAVQGDAIIRRGKIAVVKDGSILAQIKGLDAVFEATGTVIAGGRYAKAVLSAGKHLILMNSEIDLIFGPYLSRLARENHVVCTSCDGDQYGILKHLIDELTEWGFQLVMAGNMKGFLDRYANPQSIIVEADKRMLDYKACTSYTDGTKLNIEMAIIANAIGLHTMRSGMYGPVCDDIDHVQNAFDFGALWQAKTPMVDYVLGAMPGGGIFAVGYCDDPYQQSMLRYYKMGDGPFYTFYRPYHLCHIEAMPTAIEAVCSHTTFLQPACGFVTNVYAYAKKDLHAGDELDGIGGYMCYGMIENTDQQPKPGIPICLADQVRLKRDVKKDEKISLEDVDYDADRLDFQMFALAGGNL